MNDIMKTYPIISRRPTFHCAWAHKPTKSIQNPKKYGEPLQSSNTFLENSTISMK